jgi:hypothetical protein
MGMNWFLPTSAQAPAANTAAVATLPAQANNAAWNICSIGFSLSATPTSTCTLTISWTVGVTTYTETYAIVAGGAGCLTFPDFPKTFPGNTAVTITLSAAGSGITGTVYPQAFYPS